MDKKDVIAIAAGVGIWATAIPLVKFFGNYWNRGGFAEKAVTLGAGVLISAVTTPILGYALQWQTQADRTRGIAVGLGAAQVLDGLVHLYHPRFYSDDQNTRIYCAGSIFFVAGLTGILSAFM
eukprot:TRINITY_DN4807_c0_g2_i1.p1 TRINITY_DN4807_c0_g2~~TRINITY_DN4807_c0_g2_i1.p1  ORF type:complete len:123 (+),score=21.83 TRINITY_DN4807_c0_g2_i1:51-419(+)